MRHPFLLFVGCTLFAASAIAGASASPRFRRGPTAPRSARNRSSSRRAAGRTASARTVMTSERATEIQAALIRAGYLSGSPSGAWDPGSQAAMEKLQADNGWQTKLVPDSRAIIKLGLGPNSNSSTQSQGMDTHDNTPRADLNLGHALNQ